MAHSLSFWTDVGRGLGLIVLVAVGGLIIVGLLGAVGYLLPERPVQWWVHLIGAADATIPLAENAVRGLGWAAYGGGVTGAVAMLARLGRH